MKETKEGSESPATGIMLLTLSRFPCEYLIVVLVSEFIFSSLMLQILLVSSHVCPLHHTLSARSNPCRHEECLHSRVENPDDSRGSRPQGSETKERHEVFLPCNSHSERKETLFKRAS